MLFRALFIFLTAAYLAGCAYGTKVDYSQAYPRLMSAPVKPVEVLVVDERAYVRNGNKPADYVGLVRGSYYIPYDVNTQSGQSLAQDLQQAIVGGLRKSGAEAEPAKSLEAKASSADRQLLMVRIREWKSEAFMGTVLTYVLAAEVYDESGRRQAASPLAGSEGVGNYTVSGQAILSRLLADGAVSSALSGTHTSTDVHAAELPEARRAPIPLFTPQGMRDGVF